MKNKVKIFLFLFLFISFLFFPFLNSPNLSNTDNTSIDGKSNLNLATPLTDEFSSIFTWKSNQKKLYNNSDKSLSLDSLVGNLTDFNPENSTSYTNLDILNVTLQPSNSSWTRFRDFDNDASLPSTNIALVQDEAGEMDDPYDTTVFFARNNFAFNITCSWEYNPSSNNLYTNLYLFNQSQFHNFENYIQPWRIWPNIRTIDSFDASHTNNDWLFSYSNLISGSGTLNGTIKLVGSMNKAGWYYLVMWGPGYNLLDQPRVSTRGVLVSEGSASINLTANQIMDMYRPSLGKVNGFIDKPDKVYERIVEGKDEVYGDSLALIYIYEYTERKLEDGGLKSNNDWAPFIMYINPDSIGSFPNRVAYFQDDSWADFQDRYVNIIDPNSSFSDGTHNFKINITAELAPFLNETIKTNATISKTPISMENRLGSAIRFATTTNSHGYEIKPYNSLVGTTFNWTEIPKIPLTDSILRDLYNRTINDFLNDDWHLWAFGKYFPKTTPFSLYFNSLFTSPFLVSGLENILLIKEHVKDWIGALLPDSVYFNSNLDLEVNITIDIPVNFTVTYPKNEPAVGEFAEFTLKIGNMGNPNITIDYMINYSMDFSMLLFSGAYNITKNDSIHFEIPLQEINLVLGFLGIDDGLSGLGSRQFQKVIDNALASVSNYVSIENFLLGSHVVGNLVSCDIKIHLWPIIKKIISTYKPDWAIACGIIDLLILNNQTGLDLIISPQLQGVINGTIVGDGMNFDNGAVFEFNDTQKSITYQFERTQDFSTTYIHLESLLYFLNFHIDWAFEINFNDLIHYFGQEDLRWELGTYPSINFAPTSMDDSEFLALNWIDWASTVPTPPNLVITTSSPTSSFTIDLNWNSSNGADNYTLYRYTSPIITSNLNTSTKLKTIIGTSTTDIVPTLGRWYYAVTANNETGSSGPSNSPYIDVEGLSETAFIWNQTWGSTNREYGQDVKADSKGNSYVVGYTNNFGAGGNDILLLKYDPLGNFEWNITFGGSGNDFGYGAALDSSDNIYVVGQFRNTTTIQTDMVVIKFNSLGEKIWNKTFGQKNTVSDIGYDIDIDNDDNILLVGTTSSPGLSTQSLLVKLDSSGNYLWNETWGGSGEEKSSGIGVDSQGNVYVTGYTYSFLPSDFETFLLKYNNLGQLQWNITWRDIKQVGYTGNSLGESIAIDSNDFIYITGMAHNWHGTTTSYNNELILIKFDDMGNNIWNASWCWTNNTNSHGYDVTIDSAEFLYVTGYFYPNAILRQQMTLVKYDTSGSLLWNTTWGGNGDDNMYGVTTDSSINLYVTGTTESYGPGSPKYNIELLKYLINDTIKPSVLVNYYDNQAEAGIGFVNVQVNVSDNYHINEPVQVRFFEPDSTIIGTFDMNNPNGDLWNYTWSVGSFTPDIDYYFNIIAKDDSNNLNDTVINYFNVNDTINPSVILSSHDSQTQAGIGLINVQIDVTDNYQIQNPVKIRFYEPDSTIIGTYNMNNPGGDTWTYAWSTGSYPPDINYYFRIIVNDTAGNINDTVIEYFNIIDTLNPSVVIISYDNQAEVDIGSINVMLTATDNYQIKGPVQIEFYEPNSTLINIFAMNNPSGNLWNYTWDVGLHPPNYSYYFRIIANDTLNNINDTTIEYFNIIEFGPPSSPLLTIITPSPTTNFDISLEWTTSFGADNYSLYRYTSSITSSNLYLATLITSITENNTIDSVPGTGRWYYGVVSTNESGSSDPSNSPYIDVQEVPAPPSPPVLTINTLSPTTSFDISIEWTHSPGSDNYTLYRYSSPISSSNLNLATEVKTITETTTTDTVPGIGRWYYAVVANNGSGSSNLSNYDFIDVEEPPTGGSGAIPGYSLYFIGLTSLLMIFIVYKKKFKVKQKS